MENKLIPLTEFVNRIDELIAPPEYYNVDEANNSKFHAVKRYAKFLSQPLTLSMFVPCDDEGNVLENPSPMKASDEINEYEDRIEAFREAQSKCLFEGWNLRCRKKNLGFKIVYCDDFEINLDTLSTEWMVEAGSFSGKLIGNTIGQVADQFRGIILSETALKQIYG